MELTILLLAITAISGVALKPADIDYDNHVSIDDEKLNIDLKIPHHHNLPCSRKHHGHCKPQSQGSVPSNSAAVWFMNKYPSTSGSISNINSGASGNWPPGNPSNNYQSGSSTSNVSGNRPVHLDQIIQEFSQSQGSTGQGSNSSPSNNPNQSVGPGNSNSGNNNNSGGSGSSNTNLNNIVNNLSNSVTGADVVLNVTVINHVHNNGTVNKPGKDKNNSNNKPSGGSNSNNNPNGSNNSNTMQGNGPTTTIGNNNNNISVIIVGPNSLLITLPIGSIDPDLINAILNNNGSNSNNPSMSGNNSMPSNPSMSGNNSMPSNPSMSGNNSMPSNPSMSGNNSMPSNPSMSGNNSMPSNPSMSGNNSMPTNPSMSGNNSMPSNPSMSSNNSMPTNQSMSGGMPSPSGGPNENNMPPNNCEGLIDGNLDLNVGDLLSSLLSGSSASGPPLNLTLCLLDLVKVNATVDSGSQPSSGSGNNSMPTNPSMSGGMPTDPSMNGSMPTDPSMSGGMPPNPPMSGGMPTDPSMSGGMPSPSGQPSGGSNGNNMPPKNCEGLLDGNLDLNVGDLLSSILSGSSESGPPLNLTLCLLDLVKVNATVDSGGQPSMPTNPSMSGDMPPNPSMSGGMPTDPSMNGSMPTDPSMSGGMPSPSGQPSGGSNENNMPPNNCEGLIDGNLDLNVGDLLSSLLSGSSASGPPLNLTLCLLDLVKVNATVDSGGQPSSGSGDNSMPTNPSMSGGMPPNPPMSGGMPTDPSMSGGMPSPSGQPSGGSNENNMPPKNCEGLLDGNLDLNVGDLLSSILSGSSESGPPLNLTLCLLDLVKVNATVDSGGQPSSGSGDNSMPTNPSMSGGMPPNPPMSGGMPTDPSMSGGMPSPSGQPSGGSNENNMPPKNCEGLLDGNLDLNVGDLLSSILSGSSESGPPLNLTLCLLDLVKVNATVDSGGQPSSGSGDNSMPTNPSMSGGMPPNPPMSGGMPTDPSMSGGMPSPSGQPSGGSNENNMPPKNCEGLLDGNLDLNVGDLLSSILSGSSESGPPLNLTLCLLDLVKVNATVDSGGQPSSGSGDNSMPTNPSMSGGMPPNPPMSGGMPTDPSMSGGMPSPSGQPSGGSNENNMPPNNCEGLIDGNLDLNVGDLLSSLLSGSSASGPPLNLTLCLLDLVKVNATVDSGGQPSSGSGDNSMPTNPSMSGGMPPNPPMSGGMPTDPSMSGGMPSPSGQPSGGSNENNMPPKNCEGLLDGNLDLNVGDLLSSILSGSSASGPPLNLTLCLLDLVKVNATVDSGGQPSSGSGDNSMPTNPSMSGGMPPNPPMSGGMPTDPSMSGGMPSPSGQPSGGSNENNMPPKNCEGLIDGNLDLNVGDLLSSLLSGSSPSGPPLNLTLCLLDLVKVNATVDDGSQPSSGSGDNNMPMNPSMSGDNSMPTNPSMSGNSSMPMNPSMSGNNSMPTNPSMSGNNSMPMNPSMPNNNSMPTNPSMSGGMPPNPPMSGGMPTDPSMSGGMPSPSGQPSGGSNENNMPPNNCEGLIDGNLDLNVGDLLSSLLSGSSPSGPPLNLTLCLLDLVKVNATSVNVVKSSDFGDDDKALGALELSDKSNFNDKFDALKKPSDRSNENSKPSDKCDSLLNENPNLTLGDLLSARLPETRRNDLKRNNKFKRHFSNGYKSLDLDECLLAIINPQISMGKAIKSSTSFNDNSKTRLIESVV